MMSHNRKISFSYNICVYIWEIIWVEVVKKCLEMSIDKCVMSTLSNTTKSGVLNDKFISECVNFSCISHVNI